MAFAGVAGVVVIGCEVMAEGEIRIGNVGLLGFCEYFKEDGYGGQGEEGAEEDGALEEAGGDF